MPKVGKKEFPYTAKGMAMAKVAAKKAGKKMEMAEKPAVKKAVKKAVASKGSKGMKPSSYPAKKK
jgi:hypothetical protein